MRYEKPELLVIPLESEDVVTISGLENIGTGGGTGSDDDDVITW